VTILIRPLQPQFPGEDNRATLHRGRRWDMNEPRELRRTTTTDSGGAGADLAAVLAER
jgi:hypothetical protein